MITAEYYLYYTLGCHLCEEAEAVINPVAAYLQSSVQKMDIADNDSLVDLYGVRIPVLHHLKTGNEIGWPFDQERVLMFMEQQCQLP